jgi:hypothetical protein
MRSGEFVASFVACAFLARPAFTQAVLEAESARNLRGGTRGSYLRSLYRRAWAVIDRRYIPLGPNPF